MGGYGQAFKVKEGKNKMVSFCIDDEILFGLRLIEDLIKF